MNNKRVFETFKMFKPDRDKRLKLNVVHLFQILPIPSQIWQDILLKDRYT